MDNKKIMKISQFINEAYESLSFAAFLKLTILKLHELIEYDSGMFFCAVSKDCSFFKPYIGGELEKYSEKRSFGERKTYRSFLESTDIGKEAYVYKALDYTHGLVRIDNEPRANFLSDQKRFHVVCIRIIHKGVFLGEIYLHRSRDNADFDDEDLFTLRLLQPHVSTVFNIIHTVTAVKYLETSGQGNTQKGMCMFDRELSLISGNVSGIEMLKMTTTMGSSVLHHIKELCAEILDESIGLSNDKAALHSALLKIPANDLKIDIFYKNTHPGNSGERFVITMELINEGQTLSDYKFKFSKREAEVIDGLIQGKNNINLAKILNLSENTVKTHIKNIYKKTGTSNRTELAYVLMQNNK